MRAAACATPRRGRIEIFSRFLWRAIFRRGTQHSLVPASHVSANQASPTLKPQDNVKHGRAYALPHIYDLCLVAGAMPHAAWMASAHRLQRGALAVTRPVPPQTSEPRVVELRHGARTQPEVDAVLDS
jgi:hypothetical protein